MPYAYLLIERQGPIITVALNRPNVRNALNGDLVAELRAWASDASELRDVRAAVLTGRGASFCAGADAAWMAEAVGQTREENEREAADVGGMLSVLDALPFPLIARVHGAALGGGAGLVAVSDIVVAADETVFGFTEVALGLVPAMIAPFALAKIGMSAARELFLTGRRFPADRAKALGLVHQVVPAADLDRAITDVVRAVLAVAPGAVAAAKQLLREIVGAPIDDALRRGASAIAARRVSAEGQEGLRAFLEKRQPSWRP
jgi:methylglutaconyl-CoA hydratase